MAGNGRKKIDLPDDIRDAIITRYKSGGISMADAIRPYGYSKSLCRRLLKDDGGPIQDHRDGSPDEKDAVIRFYKTGLSINAVSRATGRPVCTCRRWLLERGIALRNPTPKHRLNSPDFFECIDTEEKAYWLGFIAADGNVHGTRNTITVRLQWRDREHLHKLREAVGSTRKIECITHRDRKYAHLAVDSKKMADDLKALGIVPNKVHVLRPPSVPETLQRHFWRGMFDGDGCISYNSSNHGYWSMSLVGNQYMVEAFRLFLVEHGVGTQAITTINLTTGVHSFKVCGYFVSKSTGDILYQGSTVFLERKYRTYLRMIDSRTNPRQDWKHITPHHIVAAKAAHGTWKAAARSLGMPYVTFRKKRDRWGIGKVA